jgi:outer membrane biosynthesis protein TonB
MKRSAIYSALLHLAVMVLAVLGLPSLLADEPLVVRAITVELVTIADETAAPNIDPEPKPAKEGPEPPKPNEPPPPPEAAPPPPPVPEPPKLAADAPPPLPEKKPEPDPKPKLEKKAEKKEVATKPPQKLPKLKPKMKVRKKKERKEKDFDKVLRSVAENEPVERAAPQTATALSNRLTISELDAIRYQIQRCWNVPAGARDAENLIVELKVDMNPDATVRQVQAINDGGRYYTDTYYRVAAESAIRAVLNPKCSPLKLPLDKYETWSSFTLNFNPRDMF